MPNITTCVLYSFPFKMKLRQVGPHTFLFCICPIIVDQLVNVTAYNSYNSCNMTFSRKGMADRLLTGLL